MFATIRKLVSAGALLALCAAPLLAASMAETGAAGEKELKQRYGGPSYLGVDVEDVSPERAQALKLSSASGVELTMVDRDAPAGKAGLKEHDVLLKFNDTPVESSEQLARMVRETPAGRSVTLTISRDGQTMPIQVTLAPRKDYWGNKIVIPPMPPMNVHVPNIEIPAMELTVRQHSRAGLLVENLTPQLAEFFGVKGGGILVRSVDKGSAAEAAGLKAGDVIVRVDKDRIEDIGDWRRVTRSRTGAMPVTVVRDKREQTISIKLAEPKDQSEAEDEQDFELAMPDLDLDELRLELNDLGPALQQELAAVRMPNQPELRRKWREAQRELERSLEEARKELERTGRELQRAREDE